MSVTYICEICALKPTCPSAFAGLEGITDCEQLKKELTVEERLAAIELGMVGFVVATVKRIEVIEKRIGHLETGMANLSTYTHQVLTTLKEQFGL